VYNILVSGNAAGAQSKPPSVSGHAGIPAPGRQSGCIMTAMTHNLVENQEKI
jgi:hypothetical protein